MAVTKVNLLVGQSGAPTAVTNSSLAGVINEASKHRNIQNVYGAVHGFQGLLNGELIDLRRQSPDVIDGLRSTPSAALGSCPANLSDSDCHEVIEVLKSQDVRILVQIGGSQSMDLLHRISQISQESGYELVCLGIPQASDNALPLTDHCPGYGSTARWNAIATRDAGRDAEAIAFTGHIKLVETLGWNTGWLAAATALARDSEDAAPHLIYCAEQLFDEDAFLADVERIYSKLGYCVVVVCEGLRDKDGRYLEPSELGYFESVGERLRDLVTKELDLRAMVDKPGTIQRVSMTAASLTDGNEAYMLGQTVVKAALNGTTDEMVSLVREAGDLYRCVTGLVPLTDVAARQKPVPKEYLNDQGNDVSAAFVDYVTPLIGEPLPEYIRLDRRG